MGINQMVAVVQVYIHHMTGKEVEIGIRDGNDIFLLNKAYSVANRWMKEKNVKITY